MRVYRLPASQPPVRRHPFNLITVYAREGRLRARVSRYGADCREYTPTPASIDRLNGLARDYPKDAVLRESGIALLIRASFLPL